MKNPPFADKSLLGTCLKLAHATFYDALPSNVERSCADRAARASRPEACASRRHSCNGASTRLDNWFYRQRLQDARGVSRAIAERVRSRSSACASSSGSPYY